jgi:hypothetical protein
MPCDPSTLCARLGTPTTAAVLGASLLVAAACKSDAEGHGTDVCAAGAPGSVDAGPCDPDPLRTDLEPLWNGNSVDAYDCPILEYAAQYDEPDAMVFKAIIYVESRFQYDAVGCKDNGPCCPERGWTAAECACLGLMQSGPSCQSSSSLGLRADGHVNLTTDANCADFRGSVFNPLVNIELGIAGIAGNRAQVMKEFPGCTEEQYTMMAIGNYNRYGSTKGCTEYNFEYDGAVLEAYQEYSTAAGWAARAYVAE